jgi:hypothetical protein
MKIRLIVRIIRIPYTMCGLNVELLVLNRMVSMQTKMLYIIHDTIPTDFTNSFLRYLYWSITLNITTCFDAPGTHKGMKQKAIPGFADYSCFDCLVIISYSVNGKFCLNECNTSVTV